MDKFEKVMDFIEEYSEGGRVTVDGICKYFEEDPRKLMKHKKKYKNFNDQ